MAEDWARQIGLDRRSQQIILLARRACPIWPARTRQNPRNPKSTGRKSKVPGLAARAHLQASGGGLVNIRASPLPFHSTNTTQPADRVDS